MVEDDLDAIKQTQPKKSESEEKKESTKFSVPESPLKKRFPSGPYLTSSSESVSSTPEKSSRSGHYSLSGDPGLNSRPKKTVRLSTDSNDSVFMSSTPKQAAASNDGKTAQNGSKSGPTGKPPKRPRGRPPGTTKKIMEKRRSMENNITYNNKENNIADDDNDFADMPELEETPTDHEELFYDDLPTLEEIHPPPEDDEIDPETQIRSPKIFSKTKSKPLKRKSLPQMPKKLDQTSPVKKQRRGIRRTKSDRLEPYV